MADVKVTALPEATDTTATDTFLIVQGGASKSIKFSTILSKIKSNLNVIIDLVTTDFYVKNAINKILYVASSGSGSVGIRNESPLEALHVNGNVKLGEAGASGSNGIFIGSSEILDNLGAPAVGVSVSASRDTTEFKVNGTSTYVLGVGSYGQYKTLVLTQVTGEGPKAIIDVAGGANFNRVTLNSVGATCSLRYYGTKWYIVGTSPSGASISTV